MTNASWRPARLALSTTILLAGAVVFWKLVLDRRRPLPESVSPSSAIPAAGVDTDSRNTAFWFVDVTEEAGFSIPRSCPFPQDYFFPAIMGFGGALVDVDADGDLDLVTITPQQSRSTTCRLFLQSDPWKFVEESSFPESAAGGFAHGVAAGDVNNDGLPDLCLTGFGAVRFLMNRGGGRFEEVTESAGLGSRSWGTSASFVDYDRDGRLDLIVANYVSFPSDQRCIEPSGHADFCNPKMLPAVPAALYHNETPRSPAEDTGTGHPPSESSGTPAIRFRDVTVESGIAKLPGAGLGVVCADFNHDHWPDLLIANDGAANFLWINQHDGTFREEAVQRGVAYDSLGRPQANMGVAWGDTDGDGLFDLLITHLAGETNALYRQISAGHFQDAQAASGIGRPSLPFTGFGTVFADFNHDGTLDLAVVNGRVKRRDGLYPPPAAAGNDQSRRDELWNAYAERNQLFSGDGRGRFQEIPAINDPFCGIVGINRGLAHGDMDNDGDIDLLVTTATGQIRLYRNEAPKRGHWLRVRAILPASAGRDALGAVVTAVCGDRRVHRQIDSAASYLTASDSRAHFGLGDSTHVDALEVLWPGGPRESFDGSDADREVLLEQGRGRRHE